MRLLLTNLSHYCRKWILLFWIILMAFMSFGMIMASREEKNSTWLMLLLWLFLYFCFVAIYQLEIRNKPFAFCLPRHCTISSNTLLVINLIWSLFLGISAGLTKTANPIEKIYFGVAVFSCYGTMFWIAAFLSYAVETFHRFSWLLIIFTPLFGHCIYRWDFSTLPNPKLVGGLVIVWGLISYLTWRFCGSRHIDRKFCGTNYVGLSTAFNARQLRKIQQKRFAGVATSVDERFDIVGRFFLGLMEKYRPVPICTVISGIVYQSVCPGILMTLKSRGINLLVFLGLLCFSSYYPAKMIDFIVWLIPAMMITGSDLQVHSTLLLIRGRMERYASAITSFLINSGLGLLCLFIMLMAIRLLAPIMPPVHLVGKEFSFHVVDWQLWPIFIGVVPIAVMLRLIFGNNPAFMSLLMGLLFPFFIIGNLAKPIQSFMQNHWNPMMTGLLLVCIWGVFAAYLYRVCFYKDLGAERN